MYDKTESDRTNDEARKGEESNDPGLLEGRHVSRREFLKIAGIAGATVGLGVGLGGLAAACGGSSGGGTGTTSASGGKGRPIRILGTMPFSGDAADLGPPYDRAVRMAVDELNAAGIPGFPAGIDYQLIDTQTSPSAFTQKLQREMTLFNPDVTIGCALETEIRVPCQLAPSLKLPTIVGGHLGMNKYAPPGNVPLSKWVCYYGYADYFCGYLAGKFFADQGAKKVAYVGGDYDWGYSNGIGLRAFYEQNNKPFELAPIIYTPLDKTDFATEAQTIKSANPDGLYCAYMGAGWFSFPKQLKDASAMPKYFLYDPTYSNLGGAEVTGAAGAENVYTLADHDPTTPAWAGFVKAWRAKYGAAAYPEAYTNNHYQATYWFIEACKKAGAQGLSDHNLLIDSMHTTSFQNVCISPMGPLDAYGGNEGATGAIVQFQKGAGLDPNFPLHDVLISKTATPKQDTQQVLNIMKGIQKLAQGQTYPAGA